MTLACTFTSLHADEAKESAAGIEEPPITESDRDHWAYKPLVRPQLPEVRNAGWCRTPIDRFILAQLEDAGLAPSPEADRATLLRRVTYDLTGLPPTLEEIEAFQNDRAPGAYERVVDRLLASPEYGVRWAQHWLDLARFAETDGFEHDKLRPNAWRYRDWVVKALNDNMPYDRFVRLQLAGDELEPDNPDAVIATGFLLCGPDMPDINLQEERRHNFLNDMTATVGAVFLGMQFGCAQCHDHKYDPISIGDFYRLRAFFENAEIFKDHVVASSADRQRHAEALERRARAIQNHTRAMREIEAATLARLRVQRGEPRLRLDRDELREHFDDEQRRRYAAASRALERLKKNRPELPLGRVMAEREGTPTPSYIRIRGDFRRKGPEIEAAYPRVVNPEGEEVPDSVPGVETAGRRVALAQWLTKPDHPLTTRVVVNRVWQYHFGKGLAETTSDFGQMGQWPTHPQLLDWLATELPRRDWDLKQLHRLMVTSSVYRQASRPGAAKTATYEKALEEDPDNTLLWRMRRRRLEGEAIRDAMLVVSKSLTQRRGGPGVRPPLPPEMLKSVHRGHWVVSPDPADHTRRSLYLFVRRNLRYPMFDVFDRPDTNASCPRRNESTIAPQALTLLNSKISLEAAVAFTGRLLQEAGGDDERLIELACRLALSRRPTDEERTMLADFLAADRERLEQSKRSRDELAVPEGIPPGTPPARAAAVTDLCLALFNLNEFIYID